MPALTPEVLSRALARGTRGGVYFVFGDEEYLKEEAVRAIVAAHADPATIDFNLDQLRGTTDPETLASICATPPMMAEWRVVVVREAQHLATAARARSVVEEIVARPVPGLALILSAQLPDRSKAKFWDVLKKRANAVAFATLGANDAPGWLVGYAEAQGIELEPAAARALASAAGPELGVMIQELRKLADYVGERRSIDTEAVAAVVGHVPRENRWNWFDRIGEGRFADARRALPVLLEGSESGVGLVIGLGTHFLRLGIAATGGERALADALPPHQRFLAGRLLGQARRWSATTLEAALDDLLRADRLLKSASLDEHQVMEELLLRLEQRGMRADA